MADSRSSPADDTDEEQSTEELRRQVEEEYDFDDFGPEDMARMSVEEWEAVFDAETWITGEQLLDRLEADLRNRIAGREVFARLERFEDPARLIAYSDEGYAVVYGDGSVEGRGTVRRDVEPSVALCSMESYEVPEPPADGELPEPIEVPEGSGELGNLMLQIIAAVQVLAGLGLLAVWLAADLGIISMVVGLGFLFIGIFLFFVVANARLSDRFRAEEYRNRLRAVGVDAEDTPAFLARAEEADEVPPALADLVGGADDDAPDGDSDAGK